VAPIEPDKPAEADKADPGEMARLKAQQQATGTGKYGAFQPTPFKPPADDEDTPEKTWIEIELIDENDEPVPGEKYCITLPDGRPVTGTLNEKGFARVDGIDPGTCQITFPKLDKDAWEKI
jgi:hypothetical protein